jgi:hypothetical protein
MKYGIALTQTITISPLITTTTVMQFGFTDRAQAQRVMDKAITNIDPITEALSLFEYTQERETELSIDCLLPADIPTIPVNINENQE